MNWKQFEVRCTKYLNDTYSKFAHFTHIGESDSNYPDIYVELRSGKTFYMEVKKCPAQAGQFVLHPNYSSHTFTYSSQNKQPYNEHAQAIIKHMGTKFDEFASAGTAGKSILLENGSEIFSNWIVESCRRKGVEFFITNDYKVVPLSKFKQNFEVKATYRAKRSGSSDVGKNQIRMVENCLRLSKFHADTIFHEEGKLFLTSSEDLEGEKFHILDQTYLISRRDKIYEVRKLSKTNNQNVIFSVDLKTHSSSYDVEFQNFLSD